MNCNLKVGVFRFALVPAQELLVPALNKGNMLRGGFGHAFRRLCCVPQCTDTRACPLAMSCPYKAVFEPSPPPGADRLSKNQDVPRPFVFRAPQTQQTRFARGQPFEFSLVLIGRALDFLPYFVLSFREVAAEGLGLNRAKCTLQRVDQLVPSANGAGDAAHVPAHVAPPFRAPASAVNAPSPSIAGVAPPLSATADAAPRLGGAHSALTAAPPLSEAECGHLIYSADDQVFRAAANLTANDWINARLRQLGAANGCALVQRITIHFLTPTFLRADGEVVRRPEFHHIIKRLRDRINALCTFFGDGPLDLDFRALGQRAEKVRT
ncbi:MAG: hypothetical protein ACRD5W_16145, partial [Candidatus Acidiferrales bacterium]